MNIYMNKYHALGNDYLIYDTQKNEKRLTKEQMQRICNRNFGIGSDGILEGPIFKDGKPGVRIYNPDGSEAEISGNGIRIFARYLKDAGYVTEKSFVLCTLSGDVSIEYLNEEGDMTKTATGKASFLSSQIPVTGEEREVIDETAVFGGKEYRMTCVSVGNPHCIILTDELSREMACEIGEQIESASYFPNKINALFMKVLDRDNIQIEVYERGAGYTLASGSSGCAAAAAAYRLGLIERRVKVHMPGGVLEIELGLDGMVYMTGSAHVIGEIRYQIDL